MDDFRSIVVFEDTETSVKIKNPNNLKLIGFGAQGAVFKISSKQCVKVYAHSYDKKFEENVLNDVQNSEFFPKIYDTGPNYIVMEFINGTSLENFLEKEQRIPEWLTEQLLVMLNEMKKYNFTRYDARLRHIFVMEEDKKIKVIDHVNSRRKRLNYPKKLLKGLKKFELLEDFLQQTKKLDRPTYNKWRKLKVF